MTAGDRQSTGDRAAGRTATADLSIDRYQIQRLIGQGAMGRVYLANDPKIGRKVAIKVLGSATGSDDLRRRFRLEARAIAALKHPNIVELYDYSGEKTPELYLVMEYVPGRPLGHWIRKHGTMSEATALCVGHELAMALQHAHNASVVHRDLKPENVLLFEGRVVLMDFGIVKAIAQSKALGVQSPRTNTQVLGTPGFMAPEQLEGRRLDHRTDIFAMGALLYFLTTDELPYVADSVDKVIANLKKGNYRPPRQHNPMLTNAFCDLLDRCLTPKPKDRFENAEALRQKILEALRGHGVTEIRQELTEYAKDPAVHAVDQRERGIDVLLRDLKVALKDRDRERAESIVQRVQALAPLDQRMLEVTGVSLDISRRPVLFLPPTPVHHLVWAIGGMMLGLGLGVLLGAGLAFYDIFPRLWLAVLATAVEWALQVF